MLDIWNSSPAWVTRTPPEFLASPPLYTHLTQTLIPRKYEPLFFFWPKFFCGTPFDFLFHFPVSFERVVYKYIWLSLIRSIYHHQVPFCSRFYDRYIFFFFGLSVWSLWLLCLQRVCRIIRGSILLLHRRHIALYFSEGVELRATIWQKKRKVSRHWKKK